MDITIYHLGDSGKAGGAWKYTKKMKVEIIKFPDKVFPSSNFVMQKT